MKRIGVICAALLVLFAAGMLYSNQWQDKGMIDKKKGDTYQSEWKEVQGFIEKGLPQSALKVVDSIYQKAKKSGNSEQLVKALLYRLDLDSNFKENVEVQQIYVLEQELASAKFPENALITSMLAECYWYFYQQNRYDILQRTAVSNSEDPDIQTWDAPRLVERTIELYRQSLSDATKLQRLPVSSFDAVINQASGSRTFRPSLYDLLAHRAVDFFTDQESGLTRPAEQFQLRDEVLFALYPGFAAAKLSNPEPNALQYHALTILQDLIRFHSGDDKLDALIDVDLKRLKFVWQNSIIPEKDDLYEKALRAMESEYADSPISTEVTYELATYYFSRSRDYQPGDEANKWDRKTAHEICQQAIRRFPDSQGAANCRALLSQIEGKQASLTLETVNLPGQPFRGLMEYQNIERVYLKAMPLTPEEIQHKQAERNSMRQEDWIRFYLDRTAAAEWVVELPGDGDFHTHRSEIKLPALKAGHYIILAGSSKNFSVQSEAVAIAPTWISTLGLLQKEGPGQSNRFIVVHRDSGEPLKGVSVQLWTQEYSNNIRAHILVKQQAFTSDSQGEFVVPNGYDSRRNNFRVDLRYGDDRLFMDDFFNSSRQRNTNSRPQQQTIFFTDRSIYRPGQTVFFKGIIIERQDKQVRILDKQRTTVQLFDVNYQKLAELNLKSNDYGTISGSFTLPTNGLNGQMSMRNESGSANFSMEEYKRPRFEVTFLPISGSFRLNDPVKISGSAKAYTGSTIDNAQVTYRVVRQANFPYCWDWWFRPGPLSNQVEILNGIAKTDAGGNFEINFTAQPDPRTPMEQKPVFTYTVYADVTDISGETRSASTAVQVGSVALAVDVQLPETINSSQPLECNISTRNLNGEFEAAAGEINIYQLADPGRVLRPRLWQRPDRFLMTREEYVQNFPHDVYDREDDYRSWERGRRMMQQSFDTDNSKTLRLEKLSAWPEGYYVLELTTKDAFGESIQVIRHFSLYNLQKQAVPANDFNWSAAEKLSGEPGETARFVWGSAARPVHALVEVYRDNTIDSGSWQKNSGKNTLEMPIRESDRGGFGFLITWVKYGRLQQISQNVNVPWSNKELSISYQTFRDKLKPGQQEEWRLKISGPQGDKVAAEMVAGMYDASLDAFRAHGWGFSPFPGFSMPYYLRVVNSGSGFRMQSYSLNGNNWNRYDHASYRGYDQLNFYPGHLQYGSSTHTPRVMKQMAHSRTLRGGVALAEDGLAPMAAAQEELEANATDAVSIVTSELLPPPAEAGSQTGGGDGAPQIRRNLNETAFFFPHLQTNSDGEIILTFTMPEALTRWKLLGFAHTRELQFGLTSQEVVTRKELMVIPNAPRFLREGDRMSFTAKVSNLTEKTLSGNAELLLFDAISMQPLDNLFGNTRHSVSFAAPAGQSAALAWEIAIPADIDAVTWRVVARAGNFSDGEEAALPVLTNRMLVTESLPLPVRGKGTTTFTFNKLINQKSTTLRHKRLTLEFTSNPAWYAIQALPYLMEYPYECAEQIFSRLYANSIAGDIANSNPKIKRVFDSWKEGGEALASNLEKNQELKSLLLEETPWVLQAQDESERKRRVGLLFDLNRMSNELESAKAKLQQMQLPSGAWGWFPEMPGNRYMTQHIVAGFGHLARLEVRSSDEVMKQMALRAVQYLDEEMNNDYQRMLRDKVKLDQRNIGNLHLHYLYARSYFMEQPVAVEHKAAFEYWQKQAAQYWLEFGVYQQGMIALALHRLEEKAVPQQIIASLKERALHSDELGMYWRNESGYYWYQAPIETQALLIELFDEVAKDIQAVNDMRVWLLKQKQTQDWKTTKATAEACYALLLRGSEWLADDSLVEVSLGGVKVDISSRDDVRPEAGTGYFKTSWDAAEIKPQMGNVSVSKTSEGVAWGALYWQYFEQLDKITPHETPLKLEKQLFVQRPSATGPVLKPLGKEKLKPGDLLKVRIELRVDRDMEYVHMKDMRAAGLEPVNVLSTYKYQGGLGYYETTKDASTNFFFGWLPKGTFVFEYPLRVTHEGDFSNGITTIQCMYAPEFTSHSEGVRIAVGE